MKCKYCKESIYFSDNKWRDRDAISSGDQDNHFCVQGGLESPSHDGFHHPNKESNVIRILSKIDGSQ